MSKPARPINTCFVITSMHVGGAETLLTNLIDQLDRTRVNPHLVCLKELGELGERLSKSIPTYHSLTSSKFDVRIFSRLVNIFRENAIQAVITVGAGDKMFWGRLAARWADVEIVASALHSTGWPDEIGLLNRLLTPTTDAFIAVADSHRTYLRDVERLPNEKVFVIPNGIDTHRFRPSAANRLAVRRELGIDQEAPVVGIVAALRPEKDHVLFLRTAKRLLASKPNCKFLVIGDGQEQSNIEQTIEELKLSENVLMLGSRSDTQRYLAAVDVFALTSKNEAKPVSILEALACEVPVVAPNVGSVKESVVEGVTGYLVDSRDPQDFATSIEKLLSDENLRKQLGRQGRQHVCEVSSLTSMVLGYESLLWQLHCQRRGLAWPKWTAGSLKPLASV
jgi:glycosyltransferase involved in cell wall biosynthesis